MVKAYRKRWSRNVMKIAEDRKSRQISYCRIGGMKRSGKLQDGWGYVKKEE